MLLLLENSESCAENCLVLHKIRDYCQGISLKLVLFLKDPGARHIGYAM